MTHEVSGNDTRTYIAQRPHSRCLREAPVNPFSLTQRRSFNFCDRVTGTLQTRVSRSQDSPGFTMYSWHSCLHLPNALMTAAPHHAQHTSSLPSRSHIPDLPLHLCSVTGPSYKEVFSVSSVHGLVCFGNEEQKEPAM